MAESGRLPGAVLAAANSLQLTGSHKRTATHVQGDLLVTALADNRKLIEA